MIIEIHGKDIDTGEALRTHVEGELEQAFEKYAERPVSAIVTFKKDRHEFKCECSVHLSTGMNAQASGTASSIYPAFDIACDRVSKQLRRYKRKLKNHHQQRKEPLERFEAASFVIESQTDQTVEEDPSEELQPVIVAETRTSIPKMSVGEAVLQMELHEEPVLMFRNERNNQISVVYRRSDGNIGWIDPAPALEAS